MNQFQEFQPIAAIATTPTAAHTLLRFCSPHDVCLWVPSSVELEGTTPYSGSLRDHVTMLWKTHRSLIFGLAAGAVTRLIAPLLQHKSVDPAVVVVDEAGKFVISLCSGHQGGADHLSQLIALQLDATPVITGAAHAHNVSGIDSIGKPFGWIKGPGDWTGVSAAIARQEPVHVIQEAGSALWQTHLPPDHPFRFDEATDAYPRARLWISPSQRIPPTSSSPSSIPQAQWYPRVLWVGVGCERGTSRTVIETAVRDACASHQLAADAIAGIATLDLKADEQAILDLCRDRQWALRCFSADDLQAIPVPTPSAIVNQEVGTPSVAEASAILAAQTPESLIVPKCIVRLDGQPGAATVAIAQAKHEFTGRLGQVCLVGIGPGSLDQMTPAAQQAIAQADVVIGYSLYVDLIRFILRPGQIVESSPITQEIQRSNRAIELATWGLTVAVISSGDCGIYGMAGLVLEHLQTQGWNGKTPTVQVFPGITAMQAAASRIGAPLMHDFCAISLSDLLTPWPVIEARLHAAAQADFVIALYNPKSRNRTEQIAIAQRILLRHRKSDTPVALVRSAYRDDEKVTLTTLADYLNHPIDMLTTVLIGNSHTRNHAEWMITPRGYLGFNSPND
ncbi:MAG: precorrin-3B C(17)-methyltransferase [Elainellaceae cyanobacterium]